MTGPFAALDMRLARAAEHLEALREQVRAVEKQKTHAFVGDKEAESGWKVVRLKILQEPPPSLGLLAGEVCYQLRATLDNLVAVLVERSGGTVNKHHQFPIVNDSKFYPAERKRRLAGLRSDWAAIIDSLQPHLTHEPLRHPLAGLAALSNLDKHRAIQTVRLLAPSQEMQIIPDKPDMVSAIKIVWLQDGTPVHDGAELCRILTSPDPDATVHVEGKAVFPIAFGVPPLASVSDLGSLIEVVRHVVRQFDTD